MFTVTVTEKGGRSQTMEFDKNEIAIGRVPGNDILLPKSNISKKHARIVCKNGSFVVIDAKSTNGTYVNGSRIDGPRDLSTGDRVIVGDFTIEIQPDASEPARSATPLPGGGLTPADEAIELQHAIEPDESDWVADDQVAPLPSAAILDSHATMGDSAFSDAGGTYIPPAPPARPMAPPQALRAPTAPVDASGTGAGIIDDLLRDDSVAGIMVNGAGAMFIEQGGQTVRAPQSLASDDEIYAVLDQLLATIGQKRSGETPLIDVRLKDGARLHAVLPPLSLVGPCLTIHTPNHQPLRVDDLVASATLTPEMASFLETCVVARKNILVSGGSRVGKTTMLSVLASFIPAEERVITIEEIAELKLEQEHTVSLEAHPAAADGHGGVSVSELVRNAVRMRPQRLIVDELRGVESFDLLSAMASGDDGTLATTHAQSTHDALARLEGQVRLRGGSTSTEAVRELVARSVDIVVHLARFADGSRRVVDIAEITGTDGNHIAVQSLFVFEHKGLDSSGKLAGRYRPTGVTPRFFEDLTALGVGVDLTIFQE